MKKLLLVSTLFMASTVAMAAHHGMNLTNKSGMTLYTFDKDSGGTSACYGGCAVKWPPFTVAEDAELKEGWGVIERQDGTKQWTYKGQPLYTWVGDQKQGDTTGDGVGGVWHVAKKAHAGMDKAKKKVKAYTY